MSGPVLRRLPELRLSGALVAGPMAASVTSLVVRHALGAPAAAEILWADLAPAHRAEIAIGAPVEIGVRGEGWLFDGEITAIEHQVDGAGGRILRVRAFDRLHRLRKRQRPRALSEVTLATLLAEAMAEVGAASFVAPDTPPRPTLIQHDQSDFDLIAECAAAHGYYLRLQDSVLDACSLAGDGRPALPLGVGAELLAARGATSVETLRRSSEAQGWSPADLAPIAATAGLARQDAVELRDIDGGAFSDLGARFLLNRVGADRDEALGFAQADMDRAVAAQLVLEATVAGTAALLPGRVLAVRGIADEVDGAFVATVTEHRFDAAMGYVVELSTAPPPAPARARVPAVTLGTIVDVDDPQRLGRARALLPAFGGVQSGWMPVLSLGAGTGKGAVLLPEPDDDALVLLPDGDPARGIILGGLYATGNADPRLAWDGVPRAYELQAPGGQKLRLSGHDASCRLETGAGDVFEFGPDGAKLHATGDLVIEAPGRRLRLRAAAIDFERA